MAHTQQIRDQAAEWADALQQRGDDLALRRDFERWRSSDPAHAEAYERIDRGYSLTRAIEGSSAYASLRAETLARVARRRRQRRRAAFAIAASLVLAIAAVLTFDRGLRNELQYQQARALYALKGENLYRTAVGERKIVALADGTALTLNTDSRVLVNYHEHRRDIALLRGQALFEVAHDPTRPFVVQAGERRITALGTVFDVRMSPDDAVAVTLVEGRITVEDISPPSVEEAAVAAPKPRIAVLHAGEQLIATAAAPEPVIQRADTRRATSWREGMLIFEDEDLSDAIAEVNRYSDRQIELASADLGTLHISGAFKTGDPDAFLQTVSWYLPIKVIQAGDKRIIVGHRS